MHFFDHFLLNALPFLSKSLLRSLDLAKCVDHVHRGHAHGDHRVYLLYDHVLYVHHDHDHRDYDHRQHTVETTDFHSLRPSLIKCATINLCVLSDSGLPLLFPVLFSSFHNGSCFFGASTLLFVVYGPLFVACCVLFVVCCLFLPSHVRTYRSNNDQAETNCHAQMPGYTRLLN